ncbi:MAG: hypothetical protein WCJ30_04405 [Deltaproteobacteria bacterium]
MSHVGDPMQPHAQAWLVTELTTTVTLRGISTAALARTILRARLSPTPELRDDSPRRED